MTDLATESVTAGRDYAVQFQPSPQHEPVLLAADNLDELIAALPGFEGYAQIDGQDAEGSLTFRIDRMVEIAEAVQAELIDVAVEAGRIDLAALSPEDLTALMERRTEPVRLAAWNHDVPLVTISLLYVPFAEPLAPLGNVLIADPHSERSFLESLAELGMIQFWTRPLPHPDRDDDPEPEELGKEGPGSAGSEPAEEWN